MIKYRIMKNIFSIFILFILISCGSEEEAVEEKVVNYLFDGTYEGSVEGFEVSVFIKAESLTLETINQEPINCVIENPTTNPTSLQCSGLSGMATLEINGSSLILTPPGEKPGIFRLKE